MNFKNILIFAAGAALGAGITYKIVEEKFQRQTQEDVEDVKRYFNNEYEKRVNEMKEELGIVVIEDEEDISEGLKEAADLTRYDGILNKEGYREEDENDEEEEEFPSKYYDTTINPKPPFPRKPAYVISLDEFVNGEENYDKITLTYYVDDNTLADETESDIEDIEDMIGPKALSSFGLASDDPDVVYVRNDRVEVDYEVIRQFASYQGTVLGEEPYDEA